MRKRSHLKLVLELVLILLVVLGGLNVLEHRKYVLFWDADEFAWMFAGYYFNLYFLQFEYFHPDWTDYEAFDHPPLGKYIIGGILYLQGYTIDSLGPKKFWNSIPIDKYSDNLYLMYREIPNPSVVIPFTKSIIFGFALLSLLLIYIFIRMSYGALAAIISTLLIVSNSVFKFFSPMIQADQILLFFFALSLLLCALYWRSKKNIYMVFGFVISSLAFLTKLNGILLIFVWMSTFFIKNKLSISKQSWKYLILGFIIFLLVNIVLNPVFLNNGINAISRMIEARLSQFLVQGTHQGFAPLSITQRVVTVIRMIFFDFSIFYRYIRIPIELILFIAGCFHVAKRRDLLLMVVFIFLVIIPILIMPYFTPRYLYWISPFIYIVAGLSTNVFRELWARGKWLKGNKV